MASEQRKNDEARIRRFTRRLAYAAVGATAIFGGLAAVESQQPAASTDQPQVFDSAPTQSSQPPVAQSGGS